MMFCGHCGKPAPDKTKFCAYCGKPLGNGTNHREEWMEISKSFKLPLLQWFTTPDRLVSEVNAWLSEHPGIRRAYMNLNISEGQVRGLTLTCKESRNPGRQRFCMDCIVLMPKNPIGAFVSLVARPSPDKHMNEWREKHPGAEVITQRVVNTQGVPSEIWIVYKKDVTG